MDLRIGEAGNFCNFAFHDAHVFEYVMDLEQKGLKTQAWQAWGKSASHFQSWKVRSLHSRCMYISLYVYVYGCGYNSKHFQAYHLSNHIMFELNLQWSVACRRSCTRKNQSGPPGHVVDWGDPGFHQPQILCDFAEVPRGFCKAKKGSDDPKMQGSLHHHFVCL